MKQTFRFTPRTSRQIRQQLQYVKICTLFLEFLKIDLISRNHFAVLAEDTDYVIFGVPYISLQSLSISGTTLLNISSRDTISDASSTSQEDITGYFFSPDQIHESTRIIFAFLRFLRIKN